MCWCLFSFKLTDRASTITSSVILYTRLQYLQFGTWPQRGTVLDKGQRGSHHGDSTLLKPLGIQIATKSFPGPTTREHWELIGVKKMSLGTNHSSLYCLKCCLPVFQNLSYKLQRGLGCLSDELAALPIYQFFPGYRGVTQRQLNMRHSTVVPGCNNM